MSAVRHGSWTDRTAAITPGMSVHTKLRWNVAVMRTSHGPVSNQALLGRDGRHIHDCVARFLSAAYLARRRSVPNALEASGGGDEPCVPRERERP